MRNARRTSLGTSRRSAAPDASRAPSGRSPVVGVDLAGAPHRRTGFCALWGRSVTRTAVLGTDAEILATIRAARPALVVVDAPLSLPRGRRSLDDRTGPHLRACDHELRRLGIRFLPLTLGPMRMLTARGISLRATLEADGTRVVEGYPGGTQDVLGWPRKSAGAPQLTAALVAAGLTGDVADRPLTHDELDAATLAWTGRLYLSGRARAIGDPAEGTLVLPWPPRRTAG